MMKNMIDDFHENYEYLYCRYSLNKITSFRWQWDYADFGHMMED